MIQPSELPRPSPKETSIEQSEWSGAQAAAPGISARNDAEGALREERNILSAILQAVGAPVVVLDQRGRIVRFNRACESTTGLSFQEVSGRFLHDLLADSEQGESFKAIFERLRLGRIRREFESHWRGSDGSSRVIAWCTTVVEEESGSVKYVIATGTDITARKHLEKAMLEISGQEQRQIGRELHDGLGQHLTGIAFMGKALEQRLSEREAPEAADARRVVQLVNEAIRSTGELSRGLLPVMADGAGLMPALKQLADKVTVLFEIDCQFQCDDPVLVRGVARATHLYQIAREAVHNSIQHGRAPRVVVALSAQDGEGTLSIQDNGRRLPHGLRGDSGAGARIMRYRASMIGGSFGMAQNADGGTTVTCTFPVCTHR